MSVATKQHLELNENGEGLCSVPMWQGAGYDAGFCDKSAFGKRPDSPMWRDRDGRLRRCDGRYDGYIPGLACEHHGGPPRPSTLPEDATPTQERTGG